MNLDMTKGSPLRLILRFTFPLIIGNVFQQFYNMVDTIIVGRYVGVGALAAVGATGTINFLILGFVIGITNGFTVLTAQKFGAQDMEGLKKSVGCAIVLSVIVTIAATLLSIFCMHPLLRVLNTPDDIYDMSYEYIMIICVGMAFSILYNLMASFLRAVGNSVVPLVFLIISAVLNIFLDLLFIINFHMGVGGAAYATVLAQGISGIGCVIYVIKKVPILNVKKEHLKLFHGYASTEIKIGLPMAMQFSITAVGCLILQGALNLLGSTVIAAFTAACKAEQLLTQPFVAMGTTCATYSAQNFGIFDLHRIRKGALTSVIISAVYAVAVGVLANFLAKPIIGLFVTGDISEILAYGKTYVFIASIFFVPLGWIYVFRNVMQGMGFGFIPMMAGVMELIGRGIVSSIASHYMSYEGICAAGPAAWIMADLLLIPGYFYVIHKCQSYGKVQE